MLRYNKTQKYICFDFETCGLNLLDPENKPWQLSYLIAEGGKVVKEFNSFIKWDTLNISDEAAMVTRFDRYFYEQNAVDPKQVLEDFERYIYDEDYLIVGQNIIGFDIYIHNIYRKLMSKKPDFSYLRRLLDTNCMARAIKKDFKKQPEEEVIYWMFKLDGFREKSLKTGLKTLLKDYNIPFDENRLHDSAYDVKMNFEVFLKQIWQIEI